MAISDIVQRRNERESASMMRKMAEQRPTVNVTPTVAWPSDAEVTIKNPTESVSVNNFGDVLKSLALLGKGVAQLNASVSGIKLDVPDKDVQEVSGYVETNVSTTELEKQTVEVAKAIKALSKEIKAIPKESKVEPVKIEIPKSFKIDNFDELKRGFVSINDNIVKLADVVRDSNQVVEAAEHDDSAVIGAVERVENAIKGMVFPIPQGSTPAFKNSNGEATSAVLGSGGAIPVGSVPTGATKVNKYYTSTGAVTDGVVWSPAAGKRWYVTNLYFQTSADATITFEDDLTAGDNPVLKGEFKGGSGLANPYGIENPLKSGEDGADLLVTTSAGNVYVTVVGYEV